MRKFETNKRGIQGDGKDKTTPRAKGTRRPACSMLVAYGNVICAGLPSGELAIEDGGWRKANTSSASTPRIASPAIDDGMSDGINESLRQAADRSPSLSMSRCLGVPDRPAHTQCRATVHGSNFQFEASAMVARWVGWSIGCSNFGVDTESSGVER